MAIYRKFRKYSGKNRRRYSRKPTVKKAIRQVRAKAFRKKVLSVIHREAETKEAMVTFATTSFNSGISGTGDNCRIIPNIVNGSADNQRIGDQIRAQKLILEGIINFTPITGVTLQNNPGLGRIAVRMMIVTPKSFPNWATASGATSWQDYLLKKGGTTSGFTGSPFDLYAPVNRDAVTCHYNKVFYLTQPWVLHNGSTTDTAMDVGNVTRHFKKVFNLKNSLWKYDAAVDTGLTPVNKGMILVLGYAYTDGSTSPDVLNTRVTLQYESRLQYEDA